MTHKNSSESLTYSYLALRKAVGWIGILLPFVLLLGLFLIFHDRNLPPSISHYYYTGMRDVFVGAICAVALFLFFYSGYNEWDNWMGNVGGLFALGVAWIPATESGPSDQSGTFHFLFATAFFLTLAGFSFFLFTKKDDNPSPQKIARNWIYRGCAIVMVICLLAIAIYFKWFEDESSPTSFVFWAETLVLVAFGISWLTKGGTLYPDRMENPRSKQDVSY